MQTVDFYNARFGAQELSGRPLTNFSIRTIALLANLRTHTKVLLGTCSPILLLLILSAVSLFGIHALSKSNIWVDHTHNVLREAAQIVSSAVDMETGMRGYLLAGDEAFLEPYEQGRTASFRQIEQLQQTVSDNPPQVQRLAEARRILAAWQEQVVQPMIALRREIGDAESMNDIARLVGKAEGKIFFDRARVQIKTFVEREEKLLGERRAAFNVAEQGVHQSNELIGDAVGWIQHTHVVLGRAALILAHAVDMETGMRGFLLAGDDAFLEPYNKGQDGFFGEISKLQQTVSDNPPQVAKLKEAEQIIRDWIADVTEPAIALRRAVEAGRSSLDEVTQLVAEQRGKTYFDAFRQKIAEFKAVEERLIGEREVAAANARDAAQTATAEMAESQRWVDHTNKVIDQAHAILASAVDMETGMRGYLLAGREEFLEPYQSGGKHLFASITALQNTVSDNPAQVQLLAELEKTIRDWQSQVVKPMIALRRSIGNAKTMDDMADLVAEARGKVFFDQFRQIMADFQAEEVELMALRKAESEQTTSWAEYLIWLSAGAGVVIALVLAWLIGSMISTPILKMTEAMRRLANRELDVPIPGRGRRDEIGDMASAVQVFKENAETAEKLQAEKAAQIEAETKALAEQRRVDDALGAEIVSLVEKVTNGDLSQRLSTAGKDGVLAKVCGQINQLIDSLDTILQDVGEKIQALADGNLSQRIDADYRGAFGELKDNVNRTANQLTEIVSDIQLASGNVKGAAAEINSGTEDLSKRTEQAASNLEETAASTEEMSSTVKQNADNAENANEFATTANRTAVKGGEVVKQAVSAMSRIEQSARKITDIIGVIDEIAFQTNLLALNASVEAARAGESGKGFAVVAQEVRQLAQRSAQASTDIKTLIQDSNGQVEDGVKLVNQAGDALSEIVGSIDKVAKIVEEISTASQQQTSGVQEINSSVTSLDEMTQQNSALVEESTAAARSLSNEAGKLAELTAFFTLESGASARPAAKASKTAQPMPVSTRNGDESDWAEF